VLVAVAQNGYALCHAADALRADKEVVLVAVAQDGGALCHAADALRADKEVVLVAVAQDGGALQHAEPALAQHAALRQIGQLSKHWALELAKMRLRLAAIASASWKVCTIAALSADIVELVGAHITRDTAMRSLVVRHHYWPACEPPPTKKRKA
jgi:citrate lyase beta subunit